MVAMEHLHLSGETYSIICALMWAIGVILFRKSGDSVPPVALNLFKGVVGLTLALITMAVLGVPFFPDHASAADWALLAVSGVVGIGIADSLFFVSLNRLGAGRVAIVDCLYSPFVVLSSWVYLQEPLGIPLVAAIVLMGIAIFVGTWNPDPSQRTLPRDLHAGVLIGILATFLMAASIVAVKPILNRSDVWWAMSVRLAAGVAFLAVQGALPRHRASVLAALRPSRQWRVTVPAAFIGTYLSIFFWTMGMKYTFTTIASVLNQLSNLMIPVLAWLFLRERLGPRQWIAIVLGVGAAALAVM
jgi:drug/metabolite transporter (DMT)-like permease